MDEILDKAREKEVYILYIKHNGDLSKFASKLMRKYSEEDGIEYTTYSKVVKYLKGYLESLERTKSVEEKLAVVEAKKSKRVLDKGKKIYDIFLQNNGDWERIKTQISEMSEITDEATGLTPTLSVVKKYMRLYCDEIRPKEVFELYTSNHGDFSVFADSLLRKYNREDGAEYTVAKLRKYLKAHMDNVKFGTGERTLLSKVESEKYDAMASKGELIYYTYLKHNGDWDLIKEELDNNDQMVDETTKERLTLAGLKRYMGFFLEGFRRKETFDLYIENDGKYYPFANELLEKYAKEDGHQYTVAKLQNYVYYYQTSNRRTEEDRERLHTVEIDTLKRKYVRGGKLMAAFIFYMGNWDKIISYYQTKEGEREYFRDDVTGEFLGRSALYDDLSYYIRQGQLSKNPSTLKRINDYEIVRKLVSSSTLKNITLDTYHRIINVVENSNSFNEIKEYVDSLGIGRESLRTLLNAYGLDMNKKDYVYDMLSDFVKNGYKIPEEEKVHPNKGEKKGFASQTLANVEFVKQLLAFYVNSDDYPRITETLMSMYNLTPARFNTALKAAMTSSDLELRELIDKYNAKVAVIDNQYKEIVDRLNKFITLGYVVDGGFERFNAYDYMVEFGGIDVKEIKKSAYRNLTHSGAANIAKWLDNMFSNQRIYSTPEELAHSVNFTSNNTSLTMEERELAAKYLQSKGYPLSNVIYTDLLSRLLRGQVTLDYTEEIDNEEKTL